jgi:type I restriction enzyme R subunit
MVEPSYYESALEKVICKYLDLVGWVQGDKNNYSRPLGLDVEELRLFIEATQPDAWKKLSSYHGGETQAWSKFMKRLSSELNDRGVVDVLRKGVKDTGVKIELAYFAAANELTAELKRLYDGNRLCVTRQVRMSESATEDSIDLVFFVNGIPVATAELKAQTAGQNVEDAIKQYRFDRNPSDLIFRSRSLVNFAVDENNVFMATQLKGAGTVFQPFNQGSAGPGKDGGKGNPLNPEGERTAYLWNEILQRDNWLKLLSSYIHVSYLKDENTGKLSGEKRIIFPRFHQWHAVESLVTAALKEGPGVNKLCQHSAGSGKSNTIAWVAHRLSILHSPSVVDPTSALAAKDINANEPLFDKVIIVTDRRVLDQQLRETVSSFDHQPGSIVSILEDQGSKNAQLRQALESKAARIIITTIQTFPIVAQSATNLAGTRFAVVVDEAHSSQSGETAKELKFVLGGQSAEESLRAAEDFDARNAVIEPTLEDMLTESAAARGKAENITFFAFTATPKGKTLQLFGEKRVDEKGDEVYVPFHLYSMKQAIEEKYILDVLQNYTTYKTYYKLANKLNGEDLELPKGQAAAALARFASLHPANLSQKAEIIVEHFRHNTAKKIGGAAKAMVVTRSRLHAVRYKQAIDAYIAEKKYTDVKTLVAFSGTVFDPDVADAEYTEFSMNHIRSSEIPKEFAKSYQVLIVAEKYQTGFDQPLLHTIYVDKRLDGITAVQTLSRINRTHPAKEDTFILDFVNDAEEIQEAFRPYYQETKAAPTDPNILYTLQQRIMAEGIIDITEMERAVAAIMQGGTAGSSALKANTDPAVVRWEKLAEDKQEDYRSLCVDFTRVYAFLSQVVPFQDVELERLYYFTKYLVRRLITPRGGGSVDIDASVVLTHLRTEMIQDQEDISLNTGTDEALETFTSGGKGKKFEDPKKLLSELIDQINERFGLNLTEADRIWFEQQHAHLAASEEIREVALGNDFENFQIYLEPVIEGQVIDRHEANEVLFKSFFNQPEFQEMMVKSLAKNLYELFNEKASL